MINVDKEYLLSFLKEIMEIPSVGGSTHYIMERIKREFESLGVTYKVNNKGAVYGTIPGSNDDAQYLVNAHIDTLGGMVREILKNGRLRITNIGGYAWTAYEGENLLVHKEEGAPVFGTLLFEKCSVHIFGDDARDTKRLDSNMEVRLDEDVKTDEDVKKLGIAVGDFVSFDPRCHIMGNGFVKSRYLDDKACVAVMFAVLKYIKENNIVLSHTAHFYIANYEEIGHGISYIPEKTTEVLSLDIGPVAEGQNSDEHCVSILAKDARTPYDERFRRRLERLCRANDIDYRVDIPKSYASDASMVAARGADVNFACIGPGVDATHHYERTHVDALIGNAALLLAYLTE